MAEIFRLNPAASGLPRWVHGLASFDRRVLEKHATADGVDRRRFLASIESLHVPVLTIAQLLERHVSLRRNLIALQVDTEGHDFSVLQSAVDSRCLPPVINYEHKHLSYGDQVACRDLLASHGYTFFPGKADTCAFRLDLVQSDHPPQVR